MRWGLWLGFLALMQCQGGQSAGPQAQQVSQGPISPQQCQAWGSTIEPLHEFFEAIAQSCTVKEPLKAVAVRPENWLCQNDEGWVLEWSQWDSHSWQWELKKPHGYSPSVCARMAYFKKAHGDHFHIQALIEGPGSQRLIVDMDRELYILGRLRVHFELVRKWLQHCSSQSSQPYFHSVLTVTNPQMIQVLLHPDVFEGNPGHDHEHGIFRLWRGHHHDGFKAGDAHELFQCGVSP